MSDGSWTLIILAAIAAVWGVVAWIRRPIGVLTFFDLEDGSQLRYMHLCNKIDTRLREKFMRALPLRIGMAIVTGGSSLVTSAARQGFQLARNAMARGAVKDHVECQRKRLRRKYVNWSTFPGAHIVIGGPSLPMACDAPRLTCPLCKAQAMVQFVASSEREILFCEACSKSVMIKANRESGLSKEMLIPGLFAAAIPFAGDIVHLAAEVGHSVAEALASIFELF
jgi:hypothetical protein